MISVKSLEKRYGALRAVSNVSFEVARGEIVGLLGHNGAGKTTVMKIMTGFLQPTAGTVTVGGIDVMHDRIGVQRQIGYLPESAPLYPEMLVQEYLMMLAELRAIPPAKRRSAISAAVRATGLQDRLVQSIGTLSKGYRQRVGLAGAILHKPDVLVLDEPTNGLDPVQILEIRALIRRLAEDTTIILSTHILSEIEAVCSRVVILIDGDLAADAQLDDLLTSTEIAVEVAPSTPKVEATLKAIDGVTAVKPGADAGQYRVHFTGEAPTPAIVKAAAEAGWQVQGVAQRQPSLETVFRDLMADHVRARKGAAA